MKVVKTTLLAVLHTGLLLGLALVLSSMPSGGKNAAHAQGETADVRIVALEVLSPPTDIDVSVDTPVTLRAVLHNNGPYGPVEATVESIAGAPEDCIVNPASQTQVLNAMQVSVDTALEAEYTIHCSQHGRHVFTFDVSVSVTTPGVTDPDPTNNPSDDDLAVDVIRYSDMKIPAQGFVGPPTEIIVNQDVSLTVQLVVHNNGPALTDIWCTIAQVTAPPGCTATFYSGSVCGGGPVSVDFGGYQEWTLQCSDAGPKTFQFDNTLSIPDPYTIDPHSGNNSASTQLTVTALEPTPVVLVHGWRPAEETWSTLESRLDAEGIPYYVFGYDSLADPSQSAAVLEQFINDMGHTGKFDIVAHSMGAMVSRYYMEERGGAGKVRQWIGVAPVNHGAAIAGVHPLMATLNKLFFFLPGYLKGAEKAVEAMQIGSDTLAYLNYGESHFNQAKWKTVPETLAEGVIYRNLAGINETDPPDPGFSRWTKGETMVVKKDSDGDITNPYWTYQGDGVVPLYLSELQGVGTDCFNGRTPDGSAAHTAITHDPRVIDAIVTYLKDPSSPSLDNCPTSDPADTERAAAGKGNRGVLPHGEYRTISVPLDSSVDEATVMLGWNGSELGLTLTSPGAEVMQPGVHPVVEYWEGGDSIWYVIDLPEPGVWTARIDAIDVPEEGEPYSFMTFYSSPLALEVTTAEGRYSFDAGESGTVVASLTEDDVPITGASVVGEVRQPDDSIDELALYDDGSHGDAFADDGAYTNTYDLPMAGNYDFTVVATGAASGAFERTAFMTLWVQDLSAPVGGIAELPDVGGSGSSAGTYAAVAGLAAAVALTAGAWYARRRWVR